MPLRLGVDLDGVMADMSGRLVEEAQRLFGDRVSGARASAARASAEQGATSAPAPAQDETAATQSLELTGWQQQRLWQRVRSIENFWESLHETELGIVARFAALASARRWEVLFITKRPATAGDCAQVQSQRWLARHGFDLPSVYVVNGSRGRIAAALDLDVIIDDTPENCLDIATESDAVVIGVFRADTVAPATLRRLGIHAVQSTQQALELLVEIDAAATTQHQAGATR
jgi:hypothetical protein